jgi:KDO2-lipid IV(A) lauroyltransferase
MLSVYKILKFTFRYLIPDAWRYPLARAIARGICFFNRSRRCVIIGNLTPVVGQEEARRLAPVLLGQFSMTSVDFFCPKHNLAARMKAENWPAVDKAYRRSKRVVFLTAHLGNWELGISYLVEKGFSVACVYAPYRNDETVRWIMGHRNPEVEWIPSTRGAAAASVDALERGKVLGMAADIPFGEKGHRVRICGVPTHLPLGPWAIASRARATVIPSFILRESPGQYRIIFHDPIPPREGSLRRQMEESQDIYRGHLEHYLRTTPEQWGVLQPFWDQ